MIILSMLSAASDRKSTTGYLFLTTNADPPLRSH